MEGRFRSIKTSKKKDTTDGPSSRMNQLFESPRVRALLIFERQDGGASSYVTQNYLLRFLDWVPKQNFTNFHNTKPTKEQTTCGGHHLLFYTITYYIFAR